MDDMIGIKFKEKVPEAKLEQIRKQIRKVLAGKAIAAREPIIPRGGTVGIVPKVLRSR